MLVILAGPEGCLPESVGTTTGPFGSSFTDAAASSAFACAGVDPCFALQLREHAR